MEKSGNIYNSQPTTNLAIDVMYVSVTTVVEQ